MWSSLLAGCMMGLLAPAHSHSQDGARPIDQVEHIIIFMQENRAFDHYYGTLKGVRGFNDRTATPVPSGLTTFYQPVDQKNLSQYMLPFHVDTLSTSAMCMDAPTMEYYTDMKIINQGVYDSWNTARAAGMGMSYFTRADLPYYYTLYDNFLAGDQYFQSTYTATNPNRMHLFTGSNGLSVGQKAIVTNDEPDPGYTWETMGEVLEKAGVSWKVYQQLDNFDDNAFAWFENFKKSKKGDPLFDKGMTRSMSLVHDLDTDMGNGKLPQVSWIVAPTLLSEHATNHPAAGEDFTAKILQVLQSHPDVYAKTVFILNYDEGGQFYDHSWTPNVPVSQPKDGISTVSTVGEVTGETLPIGPGFRVPFLVISPWTRGDLILSQVMDHTSVIRLIENRFKVNCTAISAWRRAIMGDLTAAFDWNNPDYSWPSLPDTSSYPGQADRECLTLPPPRVPATQSYPKQESGVRRSRALPYEFLVSDSTDANTFALGIKVTGTAGASFLLHNVHSMGTSTPDIPRKYGVESGKSIMDKLALSGAKGYSFALHGPNGFVRQFFADFALGGTGLQSSLEYDVKSESVVVNFVNTRSSGNAVVFTVVDNAYQSGGPWSVSVNAQKSTTKSFSVKNSGNWYDFTVYVAATASPSSSSTDKFLNNDKYSFARRFMGRMETGKDSITDPAMGSGVPPLGVAPLPGFDTEASRSSSHEDHPLLPDHAAIFPRRKEHQQADHKDAQIYLPRSEL